MPSSQAQQRQDQQKAATKTALTSYEFTLSLLIEMTLRCERTLVRPDATLAVRTYEP